jgi:hypothetical protein
MTNRPRFFRWLAWTGGLGFVAATGSFAWAGGESPAGGRCVPSVSYWPLDDALVGKDGRGTPALGTYERISPDGRFVLRSFSAARVGDVSLIELPLVSGQPMKVYRTPLSNEAFPVQGSWRYLVDVDGRHFRFGDVVRQLEQAQPLFQGGMSGFYAAASEMPSPVSDDAGLVWIRSMSWPQGGREGQGTGPLQIRTLGVRDTGSAVSVEQDSGAIFICGSRNVTDGNVYTLPMISVDGTEFSALPINPAQGAPSMRVYGLAPQAMGANHSCDLRTDLHATPGKAVFGFAQPDSPAMLAYTHNGSVYFVDRRPEGAGQVFRIVDLETRVLASAFPGITRDGRIVFGATWQHCAAHGECQEQAGYVIADPLQNADYRQTMANRGVKLPKACTTEADVTRERGLFAAAQGIPN